MKVNIADRAQVLVDALPYIQKYTGKIVVVKYGGNAMINDELKQAVMRDIVLLSLVGIQVVLVHGGGPEINDLFAKVGKQSRFINGLRYTDKESVDLVLMALAGKVNKELVLRLQQNGGLAIGLCGVDSNLIIAQKMQGEQDLGFVGEITEVNPQPILDCLNQGYIPVIATISAGKDGEMYNINADTAAAKIAAALHAENLILMTDISGLLRDVGDEQSLIPVVKVSEVPSFIRDGIVSGGMIPKINCCVEAVRRGVKKAVMIDGRQPHSVLVEMFSNEGVGTMIIE
ncbi:MAG TPA: acetylglutamate kinase [Firmicutes bacterium]|nr:acetylglutamate kinase [Bacillota bacterium]